MITANLPKKVKVVEVGPRDGLQSEQAVISPESRIAFIDRLSLTGLSTIEVGSMVSPKWVPQMGASAEVYQGIEKKSKIDYPMLVPNKRGLQEALAIDVRSVALFAAASETFSQKNINCSIDESLSRFNEVANLAQAENLRIRAYISCVLGCPYEGEISIKSVVALAEKFIDMGCDEISFGDTIGVGTAKQTQALLQALLDKIPQEKIAMHFHDTYGQALANCLVALQNGISIFDSSVAGLGGCPYAPGASGNLATEDLLYMLHGMEIETGVDEQLLQQASDAICTELAHLSRSKAALARRGKCHD